MDKRSICLVMLASLALAACAVDGGPDEGTAFSATGTFTAVADATVVQSTPGTNAGTTTSLTTDGSPVKWSYLRFDVSGVAGSVTSAKLRLYVSNGTGDGPRVYATSTTWSETAITWNNKPAATGSLLTDAGSIPAGRWVELDVTGAVTGNGSVAFVLQPTSSDGLYVNSREAGSNRPQLVVVSDTGGGADAGAPIGQPSFPIRAAFYYPWFPETWGNLSDPFTVYHPSLGFYDSSDASAIANHIDAMQYGNISTGIASWWGQGTRTDQRIPLLLDAAAGQPFWWSLYHEGEGSGDPTVQQIQSDLVHIRDHFATSPNYLRVNGKFVVFVYAQGTDGCGMADRWKQANTVGAYVVLKVFAGYRNCASQPDGWHQYAPAVATDSQAGYSYAISPGFWKKGESSPRLARDLTRWRQNIDAMVASNAPFQLVTTFDEWGEGTAVESASEWASSSGYGAYLDALHAVGGGGVCTPTTCAAEGWNCGTADDGCGGALQCGGCTAPATCGGGGVANVCGTSGGGSNPVVAIAGDIAGSWAEDQSTANVIDGMSPAAVLTVGDNVYSSGTSSEFSTYYGPTWGAYRALTYPVAGNHDHATANLSGYCGYFGSAAHCAGGYSYYSYDVGTWHLVALDSGCSSPSSCSDPMVAGSAMRTWLAQDLAAHPAACTLVYWHHPRFSSGEHGNDARSSGVWTDLYNAGVDLVVNGHDHDYERFAPQSPSGAADSARGIVEFVVGTGGTGLRSMGATKPNSAARQNTAHGVLKLTLKPGAYDYQFVPVAGKNYSDQGSASCH
jgi:hypothetical protein